MYTHPMDPTSYVLHWYKLDVILVLNKIKISLFIAIGYIFIYFEKYIRKYMLTYIHIYRY